MFHDVLHSLIERMERYHPECMDIILFIQQLYSDGLDVEAIAEALTSKYAFIAEEQVAVITAPSQPHQIIGEDIIYFWSH